MERNNKPNYSYQNKAAKQVLKNALCGKYVASCLLATPSSGKTTIAQRCIRSYLELYPSSRVAVLTEGLSSLSEQFIDELNNSHIDINFTYGTFGSDTQVQIGLPQSIQKLNWDEIDLLIVDEAHNFYTAPTVQNIIKKYKVKHQILMTGSPSEFNLHNQTTSGKKYGTHYISAECLKRNNVFAGVDMDVTNVTDKKNPHKTIKEVLKDAKGENYDLSKMMIACPSVAYAKSIHDYLKSIGRKVSISTAETDKDNAAIAAFKTDETDTLVVVNKGILGFNDKGITFLADLKSSENLDASNQLFSRVLRTHPQGKRKAYVRVGQGSKNYNKQVFALHKIEALMKRHIFKGYNGKNLSIHLG